MFRCVQISIDLQAYFTSVERTLQYSVLPQEISSWGCGAEADSEGQILLRGGNLQRSRSMSDSEWPSTGSIEFKDVWMRYRDGMQPVLKGLSLKIEGGMRVGICGRTGAGKSTIMVALFRIVEVFQGHVLIDGVDIKGVPLEALR